MNLQNCYRKVSDWLIEEMDGDLLLFNPSSTITVHLNGPSVMVLKRCVGDVSVADIINDLSQMYPEQSEQIGHDVVEVLAQLEHQVLIEKVKI